MSKANEWVTTNSSRPKWTAEPISPGAEPFYSARVGDDGSFKLQHLGGVAITLPQNVALSLARWIKETFE